MSAVAVLGVGRIGTALLARLVAAGHALTAFDVRPDRRSVVEGLGARWTPNVAEAVSIADFVFTVLPGSAELEHLALTSDGLLPYMQPGAVWIDLTSTSHEVSRRCAERATEYGIPSLGTPVGGGVDAVSKGEATLYAGGDSAVLHTAMPLLRAFARTVHHAGGHGSGHLAKLLINLLWFGQAGLVTEALLLAQRLNLAPERLQTMLHRSAADSSFIARDLPRLLAGDYLTDFGIDRCVEELEILEQAAAAVNTPHDLVSAVADLNRAALARFGSVDGELLAAAWLEEQAGTSLTNNSTPIFGDGHEIT